MGIFTIFIKIGIHCLSNHAKLSFHVVCTFLRTQERAAQARITDLEVQLSRATASAAQLKKAKDEVRAYVVEINWE